MTQHDAVSYPKTAECACGAVKVTASAAPRFVHACACLDCQRGTGSAFSYSAFFSESAVQVSGALKSWRHASASGRWSESSFCPTCGVSVVTRVEALPEIVCVPVGCFADPDFAAPSKLFWSSRRHLWLDLPAGIERIETQ
jgi:hypothetical protein